MSVTSEIQRVYDLWKSQFLKLIPEDWLKTLAIQSAFDPNQVKTLEELVELWEETPYDEEGSMILSPLDTSFVEILFSKQFPDSDALKSIQHWNSKVSGMLPSLMPSKIYII